MTAKPHIMDIYCKNDAVVIDMKGIRAGWEQWFLLISDEHFDSAHCDRKLLRHHHEQAKERNAKILKFGDIFDMMGGKYDPRSHKGMVRPEYQSSRYFDLVVEDAAKFYSQYKDNIIFISDGNHETSVRKRHEFCLWTGLLMALEARSSGVSTPASSGSSSRSTAVTVVAQAR